MTLSTSQYTHTRGQLGANLAVLLDIALGHNVGDVRVNADGIEPWSAHVFRSDRKNPPSDLRVISDDMLGAYPSDGS